MLQTASWASPFSICKSQTTVDVAAPSGFTFVSTSLAGRVEAVNLNDLSTVPFCLVDDFNSLATEKAAEIVLAGGDTMENIEKAMKGLIPTVKIPDLD